MSSTIRALPGSAFFSHAEEVGGKRQSGHGGRQRQVGDGFQACSGSGVVWLDRLGGAVFLSDEDLTGDGAAEGTVHAVDPEEERPVEGRLLLDFDRDAGPQAETIEERHDVVVGQSRDGHDGDVAGLQSLERGEFGHVGHLGLRDGEPVRAGGRAVEGDEEPVLDLLGQVLLEVGG